MSSRPRLTSEQIKLLLEAIDTKAIKNMHGEWVSQGKHSYWWVPATQEAEV